MVQELTGDSDKWEYTFKNLPKYDNKGKEYSYSVKEIKVPSNYTSKVEGTTITNTYVNKETTELPVTKIWNDYSNQFKTRPESITVELLKNGEVVATEKVTGDSDKWSYTFKDLPKYDNKGKEFSYSMKEIKVSSNYTSKVEGTTITNTYINKETTELPVTKIWEDYSNKFNTRPETITIELFKNGESEKVEEIKGDSDKWEYTFKNLPKYDNKGKEYCYSVKEIKVPENYTNKVEGTTITNTYVNKETIEIPVTKVWEDNNNQLNTRPENITVELLKNDEVVATEKVTGDSDKWEYIFKDLPKYDESGEAFRYSVKEIDVPEGYDSQVEGFTITNKLTKKEIVPEKPSVPSKPAEPSSEEKVPEKPKAPSSKEEVPTKSTESPSKVKVTNNQTTGKKLPQTNDQSNYVWVMIGLMLITVVFSIRYYKKEKQTN
ncbi:Alcohol dehydrogenase [Vagococcus fluvialis bH819]|uniref:Alcohol dehydrogenase n=1 Tax=Vagococcus fluvialis bH819 TaxID=1255619 RepID=A0A1X6WSE9_9ENTE|nr:Alcohol dehydrogenase [Vagococcus fluvialis bH819]